ncbi:MAG: enoyl-CoA hydratase/isomerase family protein [Acidimicrobiales bacterium]
MAGEPEGFGANPFMFDDLFEGVGPKSADLWKRVIAAVNGMACGGAFYLIGEVDFVIAAEHATFFDPHVSYGMPAAFEPVRMLQKMPLHEVLRMTLLGNHERLSATRAHQIGLVSEIVPGDELDEVAQWSAAAIASAPPLAVQATLRAIWAGLEHSRSQALAQCYGYIAMGLDPASLKAGQEAFASGQRIEWKLR